MVFHLTVLNLCEPLEPLFLEEKIDRLRHQIVYRSIDEQVLPHQYFPNFAQASSLSKPL
jgi:hypothetical protein